MRRGTSTRLAHIEDAPSFFGGSSPLIRNSTRNAAPLRAAQLDNGRQAATTSAVPQSEQRE